MCSMCLCVSKKILYVLIYFTMDLKFKCVHFSELTVYELYAALSLRQEVFCVEQNCVYLDTDGKDLLGYHLLVYADLSKNAADTEGGDGGELVAYTRLLPRGVSYADYASIGRVTNSSKVRGYGVGKKLMEESIRQMGILFPNEPVKIGAQTYLLKFYTELGFVSTGHEYLEDDIPHISMILNKLWVD